MRGVLADGRICEIGASEIRGYSLSEALRRLDKEETRLVEEKWKPIMAERRRQAEVGVDSQRAETRSAGSSKKAGEEMKLQAPEEPIGSPPPLVEGHSRALPIAYMGNELPENTGKRKRYLHIQVIPSQVTYHLVGANTCRAPSKCLVSLVRFHGMVAIGNPRSLQTSCFFGEMPWYGGNRQPVLPKTTSILGLLPRRTAADYEMCVGAIWTIIKSRPGQVPSSDRQPQPLLVSQRVIRAEEKRYPVSLSVG